MAKSRKLVLFYDPEGGERANTLKTVLVCMGVRIKSVSGNDFAQTVGHLLGRAGFAQTQDTADAPAEPMLVMDGFTSKRLDILLREMRTHGVSVPYKAMVTEHNLPWTLRALYDELVREHEAMHR